MRHIESGAHLDFLGDHLAHLSATPFKDKLIGTGQSPASFHVSKGLLYSSWVPAQLSRGQAVFCTGSLPGQPSLFLSSPLSCRSLAAARHYGLSAVSLLPVPLRCEVVRCLGSTAPLPWSTQSLSFSGHNGLNSLCCESE